MRLVFPFVVLAPIVLFTSPLFEDPTNASLRIDLVAAFVAAGLVLFATHRRTQGRPWQAPVAVVVLVWVGTVAILQTGGPDALRWPAATSWVLAVAAGLVLSSVDVWRPPGRLPVSGRAVVAGLLAVCATLSPLLDGLISAPLVAIMALFTIGTLAAGLLHRHHRMRLAEQRIEVRDRERRAMARELHDVIAHEVTGIVVLSQAVRATAGGDPRAVQEALARIEAAGTRALQDIRAIVAVSRDDDPQESPGDGPGHLGGDLDDVARGGQRDEREAGMSEGARRSRRGGGSASAEARAPHRRDLDDVQRLVEDFRPTIGAQVALERSGDAPVDSAVAGAAYRIVAEALSNVRRHAPAARQVTVRLETQGSDLLVEVTNDGLAPVAEGGGPAPEHASGWGLTGIAERADLVGGHVHTGPDDGDRWVVRAVLPRTRRMT